MEVVGDGMKMRNGEEMGSTYCRFCGERDLASGFATRFSY